MFYLPKAIHLMGTFAIGVLFVLISGGIDISFTATATITGLCDCRPSSAGWRINEYFLVFLMAGTLGIFLGMLNAVIIYFFKIPTLSLPSPP